MIPARGKQGRDDAVRLARAASEIFVARGKTLTHFEGGRTDEAVISQLLGPTGNLRSPSLVAGGILIVGFDEATMRKVLLGCPESGLTNL